MTEFYVTEDNEAKSNTLYKKTPDGKVTLHNPSKYLLGYLESQGVIMQPDILVKEQFKPMENNQEYRVDTSTSNMNINQTHNQVARPVQNQENYPQQRIYQPQPVQRVVSNLPGQNVMQPNQMIQPNQMYQNRPIYNVQQPANNMPNQVINNQQVVQGNQQ